MQCLGNESVKSLTLASTEKRTLQTCKLKYVSTYSRIKLSSHSSYTYTLIITLYMNYLMNCTNRQQTAMLKEKHFLRIIPQIMLYSIPCKSHNKIYSLTCFCGSSVCSQLCQYLSYYLKTHAGFTPDTCNTIKLVFWKSHLHSCDTSAPSLSHLPSTLKLICLCVRGLHRRYFNKTLVRTWAIT